MRAFIKRRSDTYDERLKSFTGSRERFLELELEAIEKEAERMNNDFETDVMNTLNQYTVDGLSGYHEAIKVDDFIKVISELKEKLNI